MITLNYQKNVKTWETPGGIHPPENKQQSLQAGLQTLPIPELLILPLSMHIGAPAKPVVVVGDKVLKGQLIAQAQGAVSAAIHAPTSGTIVAIDQLSAIAHPAEADTAVAPCIHLQSDGNDQWRERQPVNNYWQHKPAELLQRLSHYGLAGMGGAGFPTAVKLKPPKPIDTLIINGTECEPYITADHRLMLDDPASIIAGTALLAYCLNQPKRIIIAVEDNKMDAIAALEKAAKHANSNTFTGVGFDCHIDILSFPTKYPSGGEKQLIQILTGLEVPNGQIPAQIGIVVQNVGTAVAAYEAICKDQPLISRITTVVGNSLKLQANFNVLLGTPVHHIIDHCGYTENSSNRLIIGGPMMGYALTNSLAPVVKTTNCILAPSVEELPLPPPALPCIRCGHCAEACPASLLPQQLLWHSQANHHEQLLQHNLFDCIECGACSYVCPSNIPLVQYYRASKGLIRQAEADKVKADRARERFEMRALRLEQEQADKEQRRKERQEAAKLRQKNNQETDLVTQAMQRVKAAAADSIDPQAELDKLKRQETTLNERINQFNEDLNNDELSDKHALIQSKLNNTQARLDKLLDKIRHAQQQLSTTADMEP